MTAGYPVYILWYTMNYAVVTTKVDPQTKKEAMKIADALGMPLSVVIKAFLKQFIRTKSINFSVYPEKPTAGLLKDLRKSEEDVKAGRVISFKTPQDAIKYVSSMIENDKKHTVHTH